MMNGLSIKQWFLLRNISDMQREKAPTTTQIAVEMDTSRQNAAKMLEVMEREAYVLLSESETDRRSKYVSITQKGYEALGETSENGRILIECLYEGIKPREIKKAGKVLLKMIENLQKMQDEIKH